MADWQSIVDEHGPMVWRTVRRLLGRAEEAEECFQETFLSALRVSRREEVDNWGGLLRRLATARAIDRLRGLTRRRERADSGPPPETVAAPGGGPAQKAQAAELAEHLRAALAELPDRQAEVFTLRFLEEMSYKDIGRALGLTTNAVGVLLHEARERLGELLKEKGQ